MSYLADAVSSGYDGVFEHCADVHRAGIYIYIVERAVDERVSQVGVFVHAGA